jgi:hypothetical protein
MVTWRAMPAGVVALACALAFAAGCGSSGEEPVVDGGGAAPDGGAHDATVPDASADAGPCGEDMALVIAEAGAACVDLYEGALVTREADGGESAWPWYLPVDDQDAGALRAVPAHGIYPQGYISNVQAGAACRASGKRLCTLDEWTAACRGRPAHDDVYPYGDVYQAGACNEGDESPILILFGPTPTYDSTELNDPRCDQLDGGLARGGDYPRCVSAYGAFDMHGNLHEWVDDMPVATDPERGSFMGGYFVDAKLNGPGCEYRTTAHATTYHDYSTGFRCCADPR